jgi:hypothetical protein
VCRVAVSNHAKYSMLSTGRPPRTLAVLSWWWWWSSTMSQLPALGNHTYHCSWIGFRGPRSTSAGHRRQTLLFRRRSKSCIQVPASCCNGVPQPKFASRACPFVSRCHMCTHSQSVALLYVQKSNKVLLLPCNPPLEDTQTRCALCSSIKQKICIVTSALQVPITDLNRGAGADEKRGMTHPEGLHLGTVDVADNGELAASEV